MTRSIEDINNKKDYLEYVHCALREKKWDVIKEIIKYCKEIDLDKIDSLSIEEKGNITHDILRNARAAQNFMEMASILFEFDMSDYRINKGKESLKEHIEKLFESYALGTYKH